MMWRKIESYIDYGEYSYSLPSDGYTCVAVVDGFLMATAYNLLWNTQELKYFDFYDAVQSMEFNELHRILKPQGVCLILVPLIVGKMNTDEQWGCAEAENWRCFGQGDYSRLYGK